MSLPEAQSNPVEFLMNTDMREYGEQILPTALNTATMVQKGKYIFQVLHAFWKFMTRFKRLRIFLLRVSINRVICILVCSV